MITLVAAVKTDDGVAVEFNNGFTATVPWEKLWDLMYPKVTHGTITEVRSDVSSLQLVITAEDTIEYDIDSTVLYHMMK